MAVTFKEFAFTNMLSIANSLCFVLLTFVIPLLCALFARFPWVLNKRSLINGDGVDEVGENTDDRNQFGAEIFRFDSAFESFCEQKNSLDSQSVSNATTSKYEFLAGNSFCGYIENPQITSFKVQELFVDSAVEDGAIEESVSTDSQEFDDHTKTEDSEDHHHPQEVEVEVEEKIEGLSCTDPSVDQEVEVEEKIEGSSCTDPSVDQEVEDQELVCSGQSDNKEFGESDDAAKIEIPVTDESSMDKDLAEVKVKIEDFREVVDESRKEGSDCNEPSLDENFPEKDEREIKSWITNSDHDEEELESRIVNLAHDEAMVQDCVGGRSEEVMEEEELISLDPNELPDQAQSQSPREKNQLRFSFSFSNVSRDASDMTNDFWHTNGKFIADFDEYYSNQGDSEEDLAPESTMFLDPFQEDISGSDTTESDNDDDYEDFEMEEPSKRVLDEDDETDIDVLLEHQCYVRKLKKEMRNLRTIGLPTILEDSESPRMDEDLKPLKISEKVGYKDRLDEIQRFYRTYLDKMKRLDVLCHQTMYAIGFLQLKNQDQLAANKKLSSLPSIKSLLPHNLLPNKFRRHESDPVHKLVRDLHSDLELVYVGQLCLSWEILKWQHTKSEELQLFDTMGLLHYSLAAGEFQQFHVLVQRFTEDEPFQLHGPRLENYVKTRSANSSFLQVPLIKDDAKTIEGKASVSIVRLTDIIEESMHAFWRLVRADKKEPGNVELRDPFDAQLLSDIRANLAKKERRIKDLVKSGNCIVKKFQKHQDLQLTHELLVAQVELKLVGRVIGMTRVTSDQLTWCHKKLGKINILGKKVYIESSFSLFPC